MENGEMETYSGDGMGMGTDRGWGRWAQVF